MNKRTAPAAAAGAALPADTAPDTAPDTAVTEVQTPAPPAAGGNWPGRDWPADQYTGIGGDYVRDPVTGIRTPAPKPPPESQRAAPAAADTAAA